MLNMFMTSELLWDQTLAEVFSDNRMIERFTRHEIALVRALSENQIIENAVSDEIVARVEQFTPNLNDLNKATQKDGMPIPNYVHQFRTYLGEQLGPSFHKGSTSQDILDTAFVVALGEANSILVDRLTKISQILGDINERFGNEHLMARTRMQAALPSTVRERNTRWKLMIDKSIAKLEDVNKELVVLQFGGPIGDGREYGNRSQSVALRVAHILEIGFSRYSWQTNRERLTGYANWLSETSAAFGKVATDLLLMSQQGIDEASFKGAGKSSAMPHKQNPVLGETVVAQSKTIALLAGGMHLAQIHEQERSGVSWSMEWMILPQMCVLTGSAALNLIQFLESIESLGLRSNQP